MSSMVLGFDSELDRTAFMREFSQIAGWMGDTHGSTGVLTFHGYGGNVELDFKSEHDQSRLAGRFSVIFHSNMLVAEAGAAYDRVVDNASRHRGKVKSTTDW